MALTKVTTGGITDATIATADIADNNVTEAKLALNAVTNNRVANGAITNAKIGNGAIDTAKLTDEAVTLAKLEHGTSSNDGKFLRANNGADPTFETVTGTTINNNADNRVITGSGTANTLEGESGLLFDSSQRLLLGNSGSRNVGGSTTNSKIQIEGTSTNTSSISLVNNEGSTAAPFIFFGKTRGNSVGESGIVQDGDTLGGLSFIGADSVDTNNRTAEITAKVNGTPSNNTIPTDLTFSTSAQNASQLAERMRIDSSGKVGIGKTPSSTLDIETASNANGFNLNCIGTPPNYFLNVRDDNVSKFYISAAGKIGIGTDTPEEELTIASGNPCLRLNDSDNYHRIVSSGEQLTLECDTGNARAGSYIAFRVDGATDKCRVTEHGLTPNGSDTAAANALDDYEEGTWTPANSTVGFTSGSTVEGSYTKIGDLVYAYCVCQIADNASGIDLYIDGLPFTSKNGTAGSFIQGGFTTYTSQGNYANALIGNNSTRVKFYKLDGSNWQSTDWDDKHLRFALVYKTA